MQPSDDKLLHGAERPRPKGGALSYAYTLNQKPACHASPNYISDLWRQVYNWVPKHFFL